MIVMVGLGMRVAPSGTTAAIISSEDVVARWGGEEFVVGMARYD